MNVFATAAAATLIACTSAAFAASGIETRQVQFKKGESGASIRGTLKGDQTIDYKLGAGAGQTMVIADAGGERDPQNRRGNGSLDNLSVASRRCAQTDRCDRRRFPILPGSRFRMAKLAKL